MTDINGFLIIDKPRGMTSNDVLKILKRTFGKVKCGHAGTLDPLATGVLPIAFGEATKALPYIRDQTKGYRFEVTWGEQRTTDDEEGEVLHTSPKRPSETDIEALLPRFRGLIQQIPPRFSAVKIEGKRAYDMARQNKDFEIKARQVEVKSLQLISMLDKGRALFDLICSSGTYVRSLARDMGEAFGCYGYASMIDRTFSGPFAKSQGVSLEMLAISPQNVIQRDHMVSINSVLDDIPAIVLPHLTEKRLKNGGVVRVPFHQLRESGAREGDSVLCLSERSIPLGIAVVKESALQPERLFNLS